MEKAHDNKEHVYFSCGCREWCINPKDETVTVSMPTGTTMEHQCKKITVYREIMGLKRYFQKNATN